MQQLGFVLLQLDEASRLILDGRLAQLRLALLLLDNAAEIQMDRFISGQLGHDRMRERIRSTAIDLGADQDPNLDPNLQTLIQWQPLSAKKKKELDKYFDEKVRFLVNRCKTLDLGLGESLCFLHRYRNEAYHRAKVRPETIATAGRILLEINSEMLSCVPIEFFGWSSGEDYSWMDSRFGDCKHGPVDYKNYIHKAITDIRSRVELSHESIKSTLASHLEDRISNLIDTLEEMVRNRWFKSIEEAVRYSQYAADVRKGILKPTSPRDAISVFENYKAPLKFSFVEGLMRRSPTVGKASSYVDSFRRFAVLEKELEGIEADIMELYMEIEAHLELQDDIARGK